MNQKSHCHQYEIKGVPPAEAIKVEGVIIHGEVNMLTDFFSKNREHEEGLGGVLGNRLDGRSKNLPPLEGNNPHQNTH